MLFRRQFLLSFETVCIAGLNVKYKHPTFISFISFTLNLFLLHDATEAAQLQVRSAKKWTFPFFETKLKATCHVVFCWYFGYLSFTLYSAVGIGGWFVTECQTIVTSIARENDLNCNDWKYPTLTFGLNGFTSNTTTFTIQLLLVPIKARIGTRLLRKKSDQICVTRTPTHHPNLLKFQKHAMQHLRLCNKFMLRKFIYSFKKLLRIFYHKSWTAVAACSSWSLLSSCWIQAILWNYNHVGAQPSILHCYVQNGIGKHSSFIQQQPAT